jgi:hypothetical protein
LFICIYCKKSTPDVEPSEAHVFPNSLGGTESTTDTVCSECNGRINREVETPVAPYFSVFRNLYGVEGRRGMPGVKATARVEGREASVTLGPGGAPRSPIVHPTKSPDGTKAFFVYGTSEMRQEKIASIAKSDPDIKWETADYEVSVELVIDGPPLGNPLRRLAAKVALERFAQIRGAAIAADSDFDVIREFILTGVEQQPCCGVTADPVLWKKSSFGPVRPPAHAVVIVFHQADPVVGGFVIFFGMFLYWVILSRRYQALGSVDDLLIEWPHIRASTRPLLRSGLGSIRVPWSRYVNEYASDPAGAMQAALKVAQARFQQTLDAIGEPGVSP